MSDEQPAEEVAVKKTNEPRNKAITQQALPACKPVLEPIWVIFIFLSIGVVCIPIGAVCLHYGLKAKEVTFRYDDFCMQNITNNAARQEYLWQNMGNPTALRCDISIPIDKNIAGPVYMYIQLSNFYQNHRRYVKSRSDTQLANLDNPSTSLCDPIRYYQGNENQVINPCGLTSWSYFNDTFDMNLVRADGTMEAPSVQTSGIAFSSDVKTRFGDQLTSFFNFAPNQSDPLRGGAPIIGPVNSDERFINWMRLAAMSKFRKLWGKLDIDLHEGDTVTVSIINQYNTYSFSGEKTLVLGNTTWLGSRSPFLGIVYLVTGGLSVLLAIVYFILKTVKPRKFADVSQLSFNKSPAQK